MVELRNVINDAAEDTTLDTGDVLLGRKSDGTLVKYPASLLDARFVAQDDIGTTVQPFDADLAAIAALSTTATGRSYLTRSSESIFISAGAMSATAGSPALSAVASARYSAWLMDAAAAEAVGCQFMKPNGWTTANLLLHWTNAGAGSGNVRINCPIFGCANGAALGTLIANDSPTIAAPAQDVLKISTITSGFTLASGINNVRALVIAAQTTLANDWAILGFEIVRAS